MFCVYVASTRRARRWSDADDGHAQQYGHATRWVRVVRVHGVTFSVQSALLNMTVRRPRYTMMTSFLLSTSFYFVINYLMIQTVSYVLISPCWQIDPVNSTLLLTCWHIQHSISPWPLCPWPVFVLDLHPECDCFRTSKHGTHAADGPPGQPNAGSHEPDSQRVQRMYTGPVPLEQGTNSIQTWHILWLRSIFFYLNSV